MVVEKRKKDEQGDGYMYSATDAGRRTRPGCGLRFCIKHHLGRTEEARAEGAWLMTILGVVSVVIRLCPVHGQKLGQVWA